jgi:hypothetical protein
MCNLKQNQIHGAAKLAILCFTLLFIAAGAHATTAQTAVTTYHYDNYRTGWNPNESTLTPANVTTKSFGVLHTVTLDDQVDAQPLVVPDVEITSGAYQGTHDVAYVATGHNTVYAIDVHNGTVLLRANFGAPVPNPLGCNNNGPNVGITSTPVIDPTTKTLYVMSYTQSPNGPAYHLHALQLGNLQDKVSPRMVVASHTMSDGTTFNFNAKYQRQRPALLLSNGNIYAGFGSFCDFAGNLSRGWLLGWSAESLKPFPSNQLNDQQPTDKQSFFLSSVWMSGYGPATDDSGNILFVTGNSEAGTYDGLSNIQESVVKVPSTLTTVLDLFTPSNQIGLDEGDVDFGSGGVMVLPQQPGSIPHLAVAAGKDGNMYLMNEDNLGGHSPKNNVLGVYAIGGCWCGESYYVDPSDGLGRVVSSGSPSLIVWKVQTSPKVSLAKLPPSTIPLDGWQGGGFFTSISSNGNGDPIIWAVSRPPNTKAAPVYLYAFNPDTGKQGTTIEELIKLEAGAWSNLGGNSNLVPVVANGLVFVASNKQLKVFGLLADNSK